MSHSVHVYVYMYVRVDWAGKKEQKENELNLAK